MKDNNESENQLVKDKHEPTVHTSLKIIYLIGLDWIYIIIGALSSLGAGTIGALFVLAVGKLMDVLAPSATIEPSNVPLVRAADALRLGALFNSKLRSITLEMGIYTIVGAALNVLANLTLTIANDKVGIRLRNAYFSALVKQEIGFFDSTKSGIIVTHLTEDISKIQEVLSLRLGKFCEFGSQCIIAIILAFKTSWQLTLIAFAGSPGILIPLFGVAGFTELFKRLTTSNNTFLISIVNEVVGGMRTVRSMGGEEKEMKRYSNHLYRGNALTVMRSTSLGVSTGLIHAVLWGIIMLTYVVVCVYESHVTYLFLLL
jgi:ATP-binding cassette subfamily B (MDR/TAP) protein 1